jgi:ribosomal protein S2
MVDQYYFKNYRLFKIPFKVLLTYHCPLGNTIKHWTSHLMLSHILAIRNDLQILNLAFTVIQLRKALNSLFNKMLYRGSFLIYAQAHKSLKIDHNAVFTFVNSWLPGLISNYKQMITALSQNRSILSYFGAEFFKRPQLDALATSYTNPVLKPQAILYPKRRSRFARVPTISLSVLDSPIWLNECHNLAIPSILVCDSQSAYDKVTYPIISNQRSVPFTYLIINLFSEACNYALMFEHLHFAFFYKYLDVLTRFKKTLNQSRYVQHRNLKVINNRYLNKTQVFGKYFLSTADQYTKLFIQRAFKEIEKLNSKKNKATVINKHTFIFNKRFFSYTIRDFFTKQVKETFKVDLLVKQARISELERYITSISLILEDLLLLKSQLTYYNFKVKYMDKFKKYQTLLTLYTKNLIDLKK